MVLDGVLERHRSCGLASSSSVRPGCRHARRLDRIADIWRKSEPELAEPHPQAVRADHRADGFTPYPFEDVGAMIRDSNPDLYLFSSDYPHIEGGRNPLGRFSQSLEGFDDETLEKFYNLNMVRLTSSG